MKKLALVILLLCSALAWAGEPNPADYTLNVHVTSSQFTDRGVIRLKVIIDGKKYELQGNPTIALLALGDYQARLVKDEHRTAYDSYKTYEFIFPDKKTRKYNVVGIME